MLCCVSKKAAAGADLEPPLLGLRCGRIVANRASSYVTNSENSSGLPLFKEKVNLNLQEDVPPILLPCVICARTFAPKSLEKHAKICEKSSIKKRKPFDSAKQRIQGTELEEFLPKQENKRLYQEERIGRSKTSWKQTHDEFLRTIRAARGVPTDVSNRQTANQIISGAPTRSNEKGICPTCYRQFGIKAYERHVAWCKERSTRLPISPATNVAKERLEARIRYRAPALKNRRPTIREKYMPGSASNLGYTAKISSPTNVIKPRESVSLPNCNKSTESLAKHKLAARKPNQSNISIPIGPLKSRPMDRVNRPVEDLISDPRHPTSFFSFPSSQLVSPLNPGKYANSPGKSSENYLTKFCTRSVTGPISHRQEETLKKRQKFNIVSARSYGSPTLNDITVNNDEFGLIIRPYLMRNNEVTWKQISKKNSNFKANLVSKLNLSTLKKSIDKEISVSKENTNSLNNSALQEEKIFAKEDELDMKTPSWMSRIKKLDQTFLICDNNEKTSEDIILEKGFETFIFENGEQTSKVNSFDEVSETKTLETSCTVIESPTKFDTNISFTSTPISCRRTKKELESLLEKKRESPEQNDQIFEEIKLLCNEVISVKIKEPSLQSSKETFFPNFQTLNASTANFIETNQSVEDSKIDINFGEPLKKKRRTEEDIKVLRLLHDESLQSRNFSESVLNIGEEKINKLLVGLKIKGKNKNAEKEYEILQRGKENTSRGNNCFTNDLKKDKLQLKLEVGANDIENIVIRTKNIKLCDDESKADLQIKDVLPIGKLVEKYKFSLQNRKLKEKTEDEMCKDVIEGNQLILEEVGNEGFSKIEKIRKGNNKYFLKNVIDEDVKNSENGLKILFKSNIPRRISRSNTQYRDKFLKNTKNMSREKEYLKNERKPAQIDFTAYYSFQGENRIQNNIKRFVNFESQTNKFKLSEVKRKIRCNIDLLRSSTDTLISAVEEKVSNLKSNVSDVFINETFIIKEIITPNRAENCSFLPILKNNSIHLRNTKVKEIETGIFKERNFQEDSHCNQVSRIPIHRLIGSETIKDYKQMKLEKRNPKYCKFPFVPGKMSGSNKTYDPFLMAEQQMQDLLSDTSDQFSTDGTSAQSNRQNSSLFPLTHSSAFVTYPPQSMPSPVDSSKKRGSVLAPPSQFDDLNSDFSSDCTETNSISRELFINDLISQTRDAIGNSTNKEKPNQEHILGRRVIIDKSKALGTDVEDSSRGRSSLASVEKTRKILDKITAPKVIRPLVSRSHSVRAASAPKIPERKNSSSSDSSGFQKKNFKCSKSSDSSFADRSNNNFSNKNSSSYSSTINGSNLSLNSSVSSDVDLKRSNSMFDELLSSFEEDNSTILPSLKSLLKSDPLSISSPIQNNVKRNGQISDDELSSIDSFKRQEHGKLSADSAYSSLNRKYYNHGRSTNDMASRLEEDPPARYREGDSRFLNKSKMSKFCHECGSRFPESAKFCCECGIKRLTL